jgi:DNA-binding CsgD family transcriptional regulator
MTATMDPARLVGRTTVEILEHVSTVARDSTGNAAAATALEIAAEVSANGRRRLLALAAAHAKLDGQHGRADELWRRASAVADPPLAVPIGHALTAARNEGRQGRNRIAERRLHAAATALWQHGAIAQLPEVLAQHATSLAHAGDLAAATASAETALALADLVNDRASRNRARHVQALVAAVRGQEDLCQSLVTDDDSLLVLVSLATRRPRRISGALPAALPNLLESRLLLERRLRAAELSALSNLTRFADAPVAADALRVLGLATKTDTASDFFERAIRLHAGMDLPFEAARVRLSYGERLRRDGNRSAARRHLRTAGDGFRRLGAVTWLARAERELSATDETRRPKHTQAGLTAQEYEVARIVATGISTREAATRLYLSPKTIEFHLGNVFRKLGVANRTQLARLFPTLSDDHPARP